MLPILRGYLKLYTTLPTKKLASFMDIAGMRMDLNSFDVNYSSELASILCTIDNQALHLI